MLSNMLFDKSAISTRVSLTGLGLSEIVPYRATRKLLEGCVYIQRGRSSSRENAHPRRSHNIEKSGGTNRLAPGNT